MVVHHRYARALIALAALTMGTAGLTGCRSGERPAPAEAQQPPTASTDGAREAESAAIDGDGDGDDTDGAGPDMVRDGPAIPTTDGATADTARPRGLESGPASPDLIAQARKIQKDLECIRGVRFKKDVGVEFQSLDDFEKFLERQLAKEMSGGKDVRSQRLLHALGLMDRDVDLMAIMRKATLEQAAAYYDPDTDTFYVVQSMPALALRAVMAHELQHALQDQHTKLLDRYTAGDFDTLDGELAVRFLVEGEATLVGHAWTMAHIGDESLLLGGLLPSVCHLPGEDDGDPDLFWPAMQDMLVSASQQSRSDVQDPGLLTKLATRAMSESMYASMQGLRDLPNFVFYSLLLPYNFGGLTVFTVFQQRRYDWRAVDALFARPPETTEQVLHPHKLAGSRREGFLRPKLDRASATGPHTEGWTFDPPDRVGELGLRIWFIERGATERQAALLAEGWNGDTARVWWRDDPDGRRRLAFDWKLAWDQPAYARRFRVAVAKSLPDLHPELRWIENEAGVVDERRPSGHAAYTWKDDFGVDRSGWIDWAGNEVFVTEGWTSSD